MMASRVAVSRGGSSAPQVVGAQKHFVHLLVAKSSEQWCASPCWSPTWELQAPKSGAASPYALFEAAIWPQTRHLTLYRFDPEWEARARNVYHDVCYGTGFSCVQYQAFRESRALVSIGPWSSEEDRDEDKFSLFLLNAFKRAFEKIHELMPDALHMGLTYTGHGSSADGALFEGTLLSAQAVSLLQYVTGVGATGGSGLRSGPLSLLNFGTNCEEGKWNMISALHPFSEWIAASDLKVGGLQTSNLSKQDRAAMLDAQKKYADLTVLKQAFEGGASVREALQQMVRARGKLWHELRVPIADQELRQTIAAFENAHFGSFREAFRAAYHALPNASHGRFREHIEAADCDVMAAAEFLDEAAVSLLEQASGSARGGVVQAFKELRPMFTSTKPLFQWHVETHGLGFNFEGWDCSPTCKQVPPCDLADVLGQAAPAKGLHLKSVAGVRLRGPARRL